jgi:hypothetical protein
VTLREKMLVNGLSPIKKVFFGFYVLTRKTSVLAGEQPPALRRFVLAQGRWRALHPPAKTPPVCRRLRGHPHHLHKQIHRSAGAQQQCAKNLHSPAGFCSVKQAGLQIPAETRKPIRASPSHSSTHVTKA